METSQIENNISKMKLDFKESNYATGRRKESQQEYGLRREQGKFL